MARVKIVIVLGIVREAELDTMNKQKKLADKAKSNVIDQNAMYHHK